MSRPTKRQIAAAATVLAQDWDADGTKAGASPEAYAEWGAGIADMIIHDPPPETLVEYLAVLEEQICIPPSSHAKRTEWARRLEAAVRGAGR
ncbi:MAG TPA: hypothetical protein VGH98_13250 [Gemmatimonadaceae bacterium]|jgi:hypothetical protein